MTLSQKIQELSEIWGGCIAGYHKSCDPLHYINIKYSFGGVEYEVYHSAYIGDDINQIFNTKRAAEEYLCRELIRQIEHQISFNIERCNNPNDESEMPLEHWKKLKEKFEIARNIKYSDSPDEINYEELYLETNKKYTSLKYHYDLTKKILDKEGIKSKDDEYTKLDYSLNYRVELLIEKLKKKE